MGTGRRRSPARSGSTAQDAPKAPRMALDGLSGAGATSEPSGERSPVLGHPRASDAIWRPEPLTWTPTGSFSIDDLDRHLAARGRLNRLVPDLCRKYRREFPARKYAATTEGSHREVAALLRDYGGLPKEVERLNDVPAEVLEKAVEAFATYFGLNEAAGGNLPGSGSFPATVDPQPRKRVEVEAAPW